MSEIDKLKELRELVALREKATDGPWRQGPSRKNTIYAKGQSILAAYKNDNAPQVRPDENAAFIAAAGSIDLPALLKEWEEMRAEIEWLRGKAALYDAYKAGEQDRADMVARAFPAHFNPPQALKDQDNG